MTVVAKMIPTLERVPLSIFQFLFCFTIANVFWNAGLVKLQSWQPTVALFANEYRVPLLPPELAATLAASPAPSFSFLRHACGRDPRHDLAIANWLLLAPVARSNHVPYEETSFSIVRKTSTGSGCWTANDKVSCA